MDHADGRSTRVINSPLATVALKVVDPVLGVLEDRSRRASLELASEGVEASPHLRG